MRGLLDTARQDARQALRSLGASPAFTAMAILTLALGARPGQVVSAVVRQGLGLTAAGVATGLLDAWGATRVLTGLLFGVTPTDPATLLAGALLLTAVAALASYLPARRAARIDPVVALRAE